jgi:hypothetical protein
MRLSGVAFRDFTVTSPGTFVVSGSVNVSMGASNCIPIECNTSSFLIFGFSLSNDLSPGIEFGGSDSAFSPNTEVDSSLSDSQSAVIGLAVGDYVLTEDLYGHAIGSGSLGWDFNGDFSLVPTPEPIQLPGLAVAIILLACLRGKIRPTRY